MSEATAHPGREDAAPTRRLTPCALAWLRRELGGGTPATAGPETGAVPADPRLPESARTALASVAEVRLDAASRARAAGRPGADLLGLRRGELPVPDAVVLPADAAAVAQVLAVCREHGVAVVPAGGGGQAGTSPDGPRGSVVALDLARLDRLLAVDPVSLSVVVEPGLRWADAVRLLAVHGVALRPLSPPPASTTLGDLVARRAGAPWTGHGRPDDLVLGLEAQTPAGPVALSASEPDLRPLLLGPDGALGVLTRLTLRVRPLPEVRHDDHLVFRTWKEGTAALRALEQQGLAPDLARLADPDETRVLLALSGGGLGGAALTTYLASRGAARGCLAVLGWEGTARQVGARRAAARRVLRSGLRLPKGHRAGPGRAAEPGLRDDLRDAGFLVGTLEASASWSELDRVRSGVRSAVWTALSRTPPLVLCNVARPGPHGAALCFTVLARQDAADPEGQWRSAAVAAAGAARPGSSLAAPDSAASLAGEVRRAVRAVVDPTGVLHADGLLRERT